MNAASNWAAKALGYSFNDLGLLERALTHKSRSAQHNERLEFLGDAVLDLVIADAMYKALPHADEDLLTRWRSRLVRGETLADIAASLEVDHHLSLGQGEHRRRSILADALEALYGAIYLDGGYSSVSKVILRHFDEKLADPPSGDSLKDPKTLLQEALQGKGLDLPVYELVNESGPVHAPAFVVSCEVAAIDICTEGNGTSRRKAEQRAAANALREMQRNGDHAS